ncbi:MAG TPA: L,D-transpeptidase family protein [Chthoniobacter sp.]|nr:L,D-transpeptidase family protein [Chthoniobacter sp.]
MKKATMTLCVLALLASAWLGWLHFRTQPVQDFPPPPADPADRIATARYWRGETIRKAYHVAGVQYPGEVFLRWLKREAVLELWARNPGLRYRLIGSYPILASSGSPGPKRREGDRQVPEGFYSIDRFNPQSSFHLSLGLNYPNASDLILSDRDHPGSDIFIHGSNVSIGCAPLGDTAIELVYLAALDAQAHGQKRIEVHVFPGRMHGSEWEQFSTQQIALHPELAAFWAQLQPGFDYFEQHRTMPEVVIEQDGRYTVQTGPAH